MNNKEDSNMVEPEGPLIVQKKGVRRENDTALTWVEREFPQFSEWREVAVEWMRGEPTAVPARLAMLSTFFERYLAAKSLPIDLATFFKRTTVVPDFYKVACPQSKAGVERNNYAYEFLHFVLLHRFSELVDDGQPIVLPAYRNPISRLSKSGLPKLQESVHSPLPYGYIDELRRLLAEGANFSDWKWAHTALGGEIGQRGGAIAPDWFTVTEDKIDKDDPDCVWRVRETKGYTGKSNKQVLEMWSPVRWVALLVKLILPLRTFQVRMLDSGEADTWRYRNGVWSLSDGRLAQGSKSKPLEYGVFRRADPLINDSSVATVLYINTNKTADNSRAGIDKGYVLPWASGGPVHQDVFYWLDKLRAWQEKYNPISRRTAWAELDGRHMKAKSEVQLAGYPDACFLFRLPEGLERRDFPVPARALDYCWYNLLRRLEIKLAAQGITHHGGQAVRLLAPSVSGKRSIVTFFPLHSLRVSLITALALEGQVPFPVLQKLVGHSRLLMTLYYTKPGAARVRETLLSAAAKLEANKEISIQQFLLDTEHAELLERAICNSSQGLRAAVPEHPAARNPLGWMPMHHGLCLVGGNTSEVEENRTVGGCYNGGALMVSGTSSMLAKHGPVPGGSRNCVRCRWFITEPHHLPALAAHFNTLAYHFDEARNDCLTKETTLQGLKRLKIEAEEAHQLFSQANEYMQAERTWEGAMKRFSDLAEDLVACWRLIERCKQALEARSESSTQLLASGAVADLQAVFEETESELLQLVGICDNVEAYPDLEPGKAVLRRSQLLDAVLYRDDLPPLFLMLSEQEQLLVGNEFMRRLARQVNPSNPILGVREVVQLIDAGKKLSEYFEVEIASLIPMKAQSVALSNRQFTLAAGNA